MSFDAVRMLVLYEPGPAGNAAIATARQIAQDEPAELTVVSVAPQAPSGSRCGGSALEINRAVVEDVCKDLDRARELLWSLGGRAEFKLLIEGSPPPLAAFAAAGGYELILLPARRRLLRAAKHPAAAALSRVPGAEVRIVERPAAVAVRS